MSGVEYRVFDCPNGHSWDAYGKLLFTGTPQHPEGPTYFVLDDMAYVKCPTCMATAVDLDGREPEHLA